MKKKRSLLPPSKRILAAQQGTNQLERPKVDVTFQALAVGLSFQNYTSSLLAEGTRSVMAKMKVELGYETAPALERLLIDQIALCWFRVGEAEAMYSQIMSQVHNDDKAQYAEKRLTACMGRYTRIVESLARIRRDVIPAVQVNIADQQIVMGAK
jgi:hypothetical protein